MAEPSQPLGAGALPAAARDLGAALLSRCRFPAGGNACTPHTGAPMAPGVVALAVSGGADSLALLVLSRLAGYRVEAVHVDHGLRDGSADEADVVEAAASRLGASTRRLRVEVAAGPNLEARARAARYAVLPPDVWTGHTLDDLAETVVVNLLRGSGLDGLAPMRPGGGPCRPLLELRRVETVALCDAAGLEVVHDPSNRDPRFVRNRVRAEVLPLLGDVAQRDVAALLARQAGVLADEVHLLDQLAAALDPRDARALRDAPPALARRAVRAWLRPFLGGVPPDADAVERVRDVARGDVVATEVAGGVRVARRGGRLRVE